MTCVSSLRPRADCPIEIWTQQISALKSWSRVFSEILLFGKEDEEVSFVGGIEKVAFVGCLGRPEIKQLCALAAATGEWCCLLNADIIVGQSWTWVQQELKMSGMKCAISRRWEIPPSGDTGHSNLKDLGLDFFCAEPDIWSAASKEIPEDFQIGRIMWDTWMLAFFMEQSGGKCADLTHARVVFHPQHGHRRDQGLELTDKGFFNKVKWPTYYIGQGYRNGRRV